MQSYIALKFGKNPLKQEIIIAENCSFTPTCGSAIMSVIVCN